MGADEGFELVDEDGDHAEWVCVPLTEYIEY